MAAGTPRGDVPQRRIMEDLGVRDKERRKARATLPLPLRGERRGWRAEDGTQGYQG